LRILLVADFGVVHSRRYLDLIQKAGCEVIPLHTGGPTRSASVPAGRCYSCSWLRYREKFWTRNGERLARYLCGPRVASKFTNLLVRLQLRWIWTVTSSDIAHVQWIDDRAWFLATAGISPLALTSWGTDLNVTRDPNDDLTHRRRKAEAIAKSALLIADSQDMIDIANDLTNTYVPSLLLPIGIDTRTLFKPSSAVDRHTFRRRFRIPEDAIVALSPRAFRANYGHEVIVRAFGRAITNSNIHAYLIFKAYDVRDSEFATQIRRAAVDCGVQNHIRIVDEVAYEQLPAFYAMGDFAINFPTMDAFPVTFLECLSCELPILTKHLPSYDSSAVSHFLRYTEAPTEDALVKGITTMFQSAKHLKQEMSMARAYVAANFDESVVAKTLFQAYERLLEASRK
jgi:glycosyltransferase involved in cell wall biosynthesis